jgi:hypothetical protein
MSEQVFQIGNLHEQRNGQGEEVKGGPRIENIQYQETRQMRQWIIFMSNINMKNRRIEISVALSTYGTTGLLLVCLQ